MANPSREPNDFTPRLSKFFLLLLIWFSAPCDHFQNWVHAATNVESLPCENGTRFFFPIEFDLNGEIRHEDQLEELFKALGSSGTRDLYVFIHGWDKTIRLAAKDYGDLTCRLYALMLMNDNTTTATVDFPSAQPIVRRFGILMKPSGWTQPSLKPLSTGA